MLADLNLQDMPLEALRVLRQVVDAEIYAREAVSMVTWKGVRQEAMHREPSEWVRVAGHGAVALPPMIRRSSVPKRMPYLRELLKQDWDACFPASDMVQTDCYVYAHVDPRGKPVQLTDTVRLRGEPFYIGKGTGQRAWDLKRNQGHGKRIQAIREAGFAASTIVDIIARDLTECQALSLEAKLIYFFGSVYDEMTAGILLNLADTTRPVFLPDRSPEVEQTVALGPAEPRRRIPRDVAGEKRWKGWQSTSINQLGLSQELRDMGYTIAIVPPVGRTVFLDVMKLVTLYQRLRMSARSSQASVDLWSQWVLGTGHLVRTLENLAH